MIHNLSVHGIKTCSKLDALDFYFAVERMYRLPDILFCFEVYFYELLNIQVLRQVASSSPGGGISVYKPTAGTFSGLTLQTLKSCHLCVSPILLIICISNVPEETDEGSF